MDMRTKVKRCPIAIFSVSNPTMELIETAIRQDIRLLNFFMCDELYDKFKHDEAYILSLDGLSENKLINIIMLNPSAIKKLSNPSNQLLVLAIKRSPELIFDVKNPTVELWRVALDNEPSYIKYIQDPVQELQLLVIAKAVKNIQYINNPSKVVQRYIIRQYPEYAHLLKTVDEDICIETIRKYGVSSLLLFSHVTEAVIQYVKEASDINKK